MTSTRKDAKPRLEDLITETEAAKYLGVTTQTLRHWRTNGRGANHEDGPRYWKFLDRIGYTYADLEEWIAANMNARTHTMPGDCRRQRGSVAFRLLQGLMAVLLVFAASTLLWWGFDNLDGWQWGLCLAVVSAGLLAAIGIGTDSLETPEPRHEAKRGKETGQ
ncbi:helix-turn-helix domain-containing protein [Pseudoscardovia radai]|uniref:helix-turn-helix domain-containing protein n=1 Tax=Pseudoscardovia radai TaxID=987066 RepID=UPI0039956670